MNRLLHLAAVVILVCLALEAAAQTTVAEQYLLSAINQERTSRDLSPVRLDPVLSQAAALHAQQMARYRDISHRFSGEPDLAARGAQAGAHFSRITENVAEGPSILGLHDALMHSPGHRANILDREVDAVGIAVLTRNGQLYAVEDFQTTVRDLTLTQQEAAVGLLLDAAGLELLPSADARRACSQETGYAGHTGPDRPSFLVRYTTEDLSQLPSKLKHRLALGQDHRVAVGACASTRPSNFSEYTIAILLYP